MKTKNVLFKAFSKAIILSIALTFVSCGSGDNNNKESDDTSKEQTKIDKSNWKTYKDSKYGFKISYPSDWEFSLNEGNVYFILKKPLDEGSIFQSNMNLVIEELPTENISLEEYEKAGKENLVNSDMGINVLSSQSTTVNNMPARYMISEMNLMGFKTKLKQIFFKQKDKMFLFSITTGNSKFDEDVKIFEEIINTISFLE